MEEEEIELEPFEQPFVARTQLFTEQATRSFQPLAKQLAERARPIERLTEQEQAKVSTQIPFELSPFG